MHRGLADGLAQSVGGLTVDGLDVDAAAYNNAQTAITLKGRRQTTLETADMTERTTHLLRLFEAAVPINAAAQANVDATQAILDQAKRKAEEIKSSTAQATYCAAVTAGLPLVDYMGDLDGQLAIITGGQLKPLDEKNADLYRLHGRVFTRRGEILNCNHSRPHRG